MFHDPGGLGARAPDARSGEGASNYAVSEAPEKQALAAAQQLSSQQRQLSITSSVHPTWRS